MQDSSWDFARGRCQGTPGDLSAEVLGGDALESDWFSIWQERSVGEDRKGYSHCFGLLFPSLAQNALEKGDWQVGLQPLSGLEPWGGEIPSEVPGVGAVGTLAGSLEQAGTPLPQLPHSPGNSLQPHQPGRLGLPSSQITAND